MKFVWARFVDCSGWKGFLAAVLGLAALAHGAAEAQTATAKLGAVSRVALASFAEDSFDLLSVPNIMSARRRDGDGQGPALT